MMSYLKKQDTLPQLLLKWKLKIISHISLTNVILAGDNYIATLNKVKISEPMVS